MRFNDKVKGNFCAFAFFQYKVGCKIIPSRKAAIVPNKKFCVSLKFDDISNNNHTKQCKSSDLMCCFSNLTENWKCLFKIYFYDSLRGVEFFFWKKGKKWKVKKKKNLAIRKIQILNKKIKTKWLFLIIMIKKQKIMRIKKINY